MYRYVTRRGYHVLMVLLQEKDRYTKSLQIHKLCPGRDYYTHGTVADTLRRFKELRWVKDRRDKGPGYPYLYMGTEKGFRVLELLKRLAFYFIPNDEYVRVENEKFYALKAFHDAEIAGLGPMSIKDVLDRIRSTSDAVVIGDDVFKAIQWLGSQEWVRPTLERGPNNETTYIITQRGINAVTILREIESLC